MNDSVRIRNANRKYYLPYHNVKYSFIMVLLSIRFYYYFLVCYIGEVLSELSIKPDKIRYHLLSPEENISIACRDVKNVTWNYTPAYNTTSHPIINMKENGSDFYSSISSTTQPGSEGVFSCRNESIDVIIFRNNFYKNQIKEEKFEVYENDDVKGSCKPKSSDEKVLLFGKYDSINPSEPSHYTWYEYSDGDQRVELLNTKKPEFTYLEPTGSVINLDGYTLKTVSYKKFAGRYICVHYSITQDKVVTHHADTAFQLIVRSKSHILDAPKIEIIDTSDKTNRLLKCSIRVPLTVYIVKVKWIFPAEENDTRVTLHPLQRDEGSLQMFDANSIYYQTLSSNLSIQHFGASDAGKYVCIMIDHLNQTTSSSIQIDTLSNDMIYPVLTLFVIFLFGLLGINRIYCKYRKGILSFGKEYFYLSGQPDKIDYSKPILGQLGFLPYVKQFEIPKSSFEINTSRQLGEGNFGRVLRGFAYGKEIAVKEPNGNKGSLKTLYNELILMCHVGKHINIVNLVGAYTKELNKVGKLFVFVEYCEHGSLLNYLHEVKHFVHQVNSDGSLDFLIKTRIDIPKEVIEVSRKSKQSGYVRVTELVKPVEISTMDLLYWSFQIACGLTYLEKRKILHRDVAARNILLAENNTIKICDFGMARSTQGGEYKMITDAEVPIKHMAIECFKGFYTTKSDVWAFAVTLWEIFTLGTEPYIDQIEDWKYFYSYIQNENNRLPKPTFATNEIYKIMLTCWKPDYNKRPNFSELEDDIRKMLPGTLIEAYDILNEKYEEENKMYYKTNTDYLKDQTADHIHKINNEDITPNETQPSVLKTSNSQISLHFNNVLYTPLIVPTPSQPSEPRNQCNDIIMTTNNIYPPSPVISKHNVYSPPPTGYLSCNSKLLQ